MLQKLPHETGGLRTLVVIFATGDEIVIETPEYLQRQFDPRTGLHLIHVGT
jgi:hypothetical protein